MFVPLFRHCLHRLKLPRLRIIPAHLLLVVLQLKCQPSQCDVLNIATWTPEL